VPDALLFVPDAVRASLARIRAVLSEGGWIVERRGVFRVVTRASYRAGDESVVLEPLTSGELSAELRLRQDPEIDALAAFRVSEGALAARLAEASGGWLRSVDPSPSLRGLALCALVARLQAEDEQYAGREDEPVKLMAWLQRHGAGIALSEEEHAWVVAPVDRLPEEARFASLVERFGSHAYALGLTETTEPGPLHELMSSFGFLADELPAGLLGLRVVPGRERHLG